VSAPTLAEIRDWPATCSVIEAAAALGVSKSAAYEALRIGQFPVRSLRVRRRLVVVTADLIRLLSAGAPDAP
jgi:hypothetical protein